MKITIKEVLADVCRPNSVFSIGFWKADGTYSFKSGVVNRSGKHEVRKKLNRNGLLNCFQPKENKIFAVTIDNIVQYNGMEIIRPEPNDK